MNISYTRFAVNPLLQNFALHLQRRDSLTRKNDMHNEHIHNETQSANTELLIEIIEIEVFAKEGKTPPHGHKYKIKIDKQHYTVSISTMTGRELLTLAGKTPVEKWLLQQKIKGHVHKVGLDEVVDFTRPGVERFMTIPNEVTEGEGPQGLRRDFELPIEDKTYLDSLGSAWEVTTEQTPNGIVRRVLIHQFPIPPGYNVSIAAVNVRLEAGYPDTQIDMAYFSPPLAREDGKAINALSSDPYDGRDWQRWSRHRTGESQWRVGTDNLATHMALTGHWLQAELLK